MQRNRSRKYKCFYKSNKGKIIKFSTLLSNVTFPPLHGGKKTLSTNLCQSRIEMACNSGSLTVTDLEKICFTDRVKQRK